MKTGLRSRIRFIDSLGFRLAALLSIALLPIGLIAVAQSSRSIMESRRVSDTALLGRTAEAAASERTLLLTTFGAAEALGDSVLATAERPEQCSALLRSFVAQSSVIDFVGYTDETGHQNCISSGLPLDVSAYEPFRIMQTQREVLILASDGNRRVSEPSVDVRWPLFSEGQWRGYLYFGIPKSNIGSIRDYSEGVRRPTVITFNARGEILTSSLARDDLEGQLPKGHPLTTFAVDTEQVFRGRNNHGENRLFAVLPVIRGQVFAIGSWGPREDLAAAVSIPAAVLYPLLMWAVSLVVAYLAVHRLVIRHIREMRGQMRRFALGQRDTAPEVLTDAPAEIQEMSHTFHNLTRILIRDEDALEASLSEKTVLLKEVHHRVKNNLQLIASIMNMQIRRVKEPSARRVLKSVQNRVMSLASVHRSLYQAEQLSAARVDRLISEIVDQMAAVATDGHHRIDIRKDLAEITLYPDQAVPLALLTTEAFTNALKYIGRPAEGDPWVRVALSQPEPGLAIFSVENTLGTEIFGEEERDAQAASTGLGSQLIQAFVVQLEGELLTAAVEGDIYRLAVSFPVQAFTPA
ncbi:MULTISPECIES: sensor histidine kinase [unclassified Haematobacter]|uniref:sensor histidine kinase n=1 Tax=unclassified Haematobacter TaxID=2640585 RepID=UPI0025B9CCA3|nr:MULTISPECIES: sensor histidine kinase [unclassified Haematobacter]